MTLLQVFTLDGDFILKFGEKGSGNGQFLYPWDVACNSKNQILVSDTRNHRLQVYPRKRGLVYDFSLQLFSPLGDFLAKYGFDGQLWKHFDSPRGVSFTADNQVVDLSLLSWTCILTLSCRLWSLISTTTVFL